MLSLNLPNHSAPVELEQTLTTALIFDPEKKSATFETIYDQMEAEQYFTIIDASLPSIHHNLNVATYIKHDFQQLLQNLKRYEQLSIQLTKIMSPSNLPALMEEMEALENHISKYDGWDLDQNIENWLTFLNGPQTDNMIKSLTPSSLYKSNLTKSILNHPTLLCLDQPIDYLNEDLLLDTIEVLKQYETKVILTFSNGNLPKKLADQWIEISS